MDMPENESILKDGDKAGRAYRAYLLRCWQEEDGGKATWRFTLVRMGEEQNQKGFARLEDLTAFLREELKISDTGP